MEIKIKSISVILTDSGPDTVHLVPEVETAFPAMGYDPSMTMTAQAGYGIEWVRKTFGREPDEVIDRRSRT